MIIQIQTQITVQVIVDNIINMKNDQFTKYKFPRKVINLQVNAYSRLQANLKAGFYVIYHL